MAKKCSKSNSAKVNAMPMEDVSWRARDDAQTLRRAGEIMGDRARVKAAQVELKKDMQAIERVAGKAGAAPRGNSLGFAKGRK